jgi:hypothetical protein
MSRHRFLLNSQTHMASPSVGLLRAVRLLFLPPLPQVGQELGEILGLFIGPERRLILRGLGWGKIRIRLPK